MDTDEAVSEPDADELESSRVDGMRARRWAKACSSRRLERYSRSSLPKSEDEYEGVDWGGGKIDIKSWPVRPPGREPVCA
jgi:hypothetical protein